MANEKGKKVGVEKDLEQLKKEIAQKGKEIEQLKRTIDETRTQIRQKEKTGESVELGKIFDDVSELVDVGFSILGTTGEIRGGKSGGKGLVGLMNELAKLAEKSETYQKRVKLGEKGVIDIRVSSRPIIGPYTRRQPGTLKISKPKKEISPTRTTMLPTTGTIREKEPIFDIFEEEDHIKIMAELPGVEENEIKLKVEENTLTITTDTQARKYYKIVELPAAVKKDIVESSYRNGILEVKLRKGKNTGKIEKDAFH